MYLLDANVLITAKNLYYGFDLCPGFWDWLDAAHERESVGSIEQVCDELTEGTDPLSDWAGARRGGFFMESEPALLPALGKVSQWASGAGYRRSAVDEFFRVADYQLVATALAFDHTLVSLEVASATKKRVKIPDVCLALGIKHVSPFVMLSRERARFVLAPNVAPNIVATTATQVERDE